MPGGQASSSFLWCQTDSLAAVYSAWSAAEYLKFGLPSGRKKACHHGHIHSGILSARIKNVQAAAGLHLENDGRS